MSKLQTVLLASGALALGLIAYLFATDGRPGGEQSFKAVTVLPQSRPLNPFRLADHRGVEFTETDFAGRWSVLFFGFTNCPDICPTTLYDLARLKRQLADLPETSQPQIFMISVDVARDSPAAMADYVEAFDSGFTGITGDPDELAKLARPLGVAYGIEPGEGEQYEVLHTAALFLLDARGQFVAVASAPHDIDKLASDFRTLVRRERG